MVGYRGRSIGQGAVVGYGVGSIGQGQWWGMV